MAGAEAKIERETCRRARDEYGVENIKLIAPGWPDRQFIIPGGKPLLIEFKAPSEVPRPLQKHVHQKLRKLGYNVQVHDDTERAVQAIAQAIKFLTPIEKSKL